MTVAQMSAPAGWYGAQARTLQTLALDGLETVVGGQASDFTNDRV